MTPDQIKIGDPVIYHPSPNMSFPATIASEPWKLGSNTWVVKLKDLPPEYAKAVGRHPHVRTVSSAALFALEPA